MTEQSLIDRKVQRAVRHYQMGWGAVVLGFVIFTLLWFLYGPFRQLYVPNETDIPALADGLLLAPGAHWEDWFTRGYSNFWDLYPEWPLNMTGFARPVFQSVIYLAHFVLGRDWASYHVINCFAAAGLAAAAFQIAQAALGLRRDLAFLSAILVVLSPPVLESWLAGLAFAIEPLATLLVAAAFLAVIERRDFLCFMLLFVAVLTKENTVWAPAAAAVTIMLRPKPDQPLRHQATAAAAMFLPVVLWLGLRFAFFGGIGGTYATASYTSLADFLALTIQKLTHLDALFVSQHAFIPDGYQALLDRATKFGTRLLTYALFAFLALRVIPEAVNHLRVATYERRWPTVDAPFLVSLWATIALTFHFLLALSSAWYAASVVVFAWPALVAEIDRRRKTIVWLGLAVFCAVATMRSYQSVEAWLSLQREIVGPMRAALGQVAIPRRQVYILPASDGGMPNANPEYVRLILGVSAEIVRIIDIKWNCGGSNNLVAFDHNVTDGAVKLTVILPACANFLFSQARIGDKALTNNRLYRSATMNYELPEARPIVPDNWQESPFDVGRRMTVYVRPTGPARFIIQHGGPAGIAWFDVP
jgi:hypothetical protein